MVNWWIRLEGWLFVRRFMDPSIRGLACGMANAIHLNDTSIGSVIYSLMGPLID